eukprot:GHVH01015399.1.p1 GENE.GHVH01015399.1~~GHVH01015399.1.p1  ORF type:complete len:171 (+),score=21.12 GHVH01015399.1:3491-4003(+)
MPIFQFSFCHPIRLELIRPVKTESCIVPGSSEEDSETSSDTEQAAVEAFDARWQGLRQLERSQKAPDPFRITLPRSRLSDMWRNTDAIEVVEGLLSALKMNTIRHEGGHSAAAINASADVVRAVTADPSGHKILAVCKELLQQIIAGRIHEHPRVSDHSGSSGVGRIALR